jgi:hypothetical protein
MCNLSPITVTKTRSKPHSSPSKTVSGSDKFWLPLRSHKRYGGDEDWEQRGTPQKMLTERPTAASTKLSEASTIHRLCIWASRRLRIAKMTKMLKSKSSDSGMTRN